jgi:hypothetical protein
MSSYCPIYFYCYTTPLSLYQVSGHAHFVEINERVLVRVDSPYDTLLITIHYHLHSIPKLIQLLDKNSGSNANAIDIRDKIMIDLKRDKETPDSSDSIINNNNEELDDKNCLGGDVSSYLRDEIENHALSSAVLDNEATISSYVILPLDERFLRGRACAIPLRKGNGESDFGRVSSNNSSPSRDKKKKKDGSLGILELEARWADPPSA